MSSKAESDDGRAELEKGASDRVVALGSNLNSGSLDFVNIAMTLLLPP